MYQPDQWEILSEINSVACVTAISLIAGRKIAGVEGPVYYVRGLLLLLYTLTWAFDLIACMLVSTNNGNSISCVLMFFNCSVVYTSAKITLYLYFVEKIYIISAPKTPRLRSPLYWTGLGLLVPYIGLIILMIIYKLTEVDTEAPYHCTIGYNMIAGSVPVLCYDFVITVLFASVFFKFYKFPSVSQQTAHQAASLSIMAKRNIVAALTTCVASTINHLIIILMGGRLRGLVASSISTLDITIVSCVVHWVTSHSAELQFVEKALHRTNNDKPMRLEIKQHQEVVVLTELNAR